MDLVTAARSTLVIRSLAVIAVVAAVVIAALPALSDEVGAPAQVVDFEAPQRLESYKVTHFGRSPSARDDREAIAKFRVVERTGNCCENYLTSNSKGQIFDLGGSYINFTNDRGKTWKSVRPINPLVNGEGTITIAPGGDIVGVEWDPYSADHLLSYKYTAETKTWEYLEMPVHTPFYDRPWMAVVPGPFTIRGAEVPYVTFLDGFPHRGTFFYSVDGLTYVETSNPFLDQRLNGVVDKLVVGKNKELDWIQPNSESPIVPLGGGSALAQPGPFANSWSILNGETQTWSALEPKGIKLEGRYQVDSKGRLHNFVDQGRRFIYRFSTDKGKTWKEAAVDLPKGVSLSSDFRVNSTVGITAISIHSDAGDVDIDYLYKFDNAGKAPRLTHLYEIGLGDIDASSGVGQDIRMDFNSVTILPDGKLAVSFLDSTTGPVFHLQEAVFPDRLGPALAIEL